MSLVGRPVRDGVIASSGFSFLKHQPVQASSIEPMNRRPAIESITHIRRNAIFTGDGDKPRNKSMIAVAMHRGRQPQHYRTPAMRCHRERGLLRFAGEFAVGCILFRYECAAGLSDQAPGTDDQWAV